MRLFSSLAVVLALVASGCTLTKQEPPAVSAPSEFGQSISVAVSPDRLSQDGVSQARAEATVRDGKGQPIQGLTIQWHVTASNGAFVEPSVQQSTTDGQGRASMSVTAPAPPAFVPMSTATLTITARPVGTDGFSTANFRTVEVQLIPPQGTLPINNDPVASFTVAPAVGNIQQTITFDASGTRDEGEPCPTCSYQWDFGNYETDSGRIVRKSFANPATYTVTLTVTDPRGGVGSTSRSVTINGPAAPKAAFSVAPASPAVGDTVAFNAIASTVGLGATLTEYVWEFGDGSSQTTTTPIATHSYGAVGTYPVLLTVKDSFGRTALATAVVTVKP